jgi:nucleotide-binding universal stress UspA family protein
MEPNISNIFLVPTDFSEVCSNAARRAASVAKTIDFKIVLLHVIDKSTRAEMKKQGKGIDWVNDRLNELAQSLHEEFGVEVNTKSEEGDIFTTIAEVAQDIKANLIFLGTHGKVGLQKLTGSFALKVITSSEVPTIVTQKRPFEGGFNKILLPMTSDAGPWAKTKWAAFIAKQFDSEIVIFALDSDELDDVITMITNHFQVNGVRYSLKVADKSGSYTKQVIDFATTENADLIMIMTNPEKGVTTFLLGSYDEEIIFNTSQIPVMCINPRDFNWKKIVRR